ncbi:hypothetical protein [Flavobacterium sp. ABG]|uniref:hypothetical protein n=1 Tax=Flavobacterium sp. ABG TaxID=1423322 RepID=UPI0006498943|nr:hypothetical protein [Flavobacterium sp. ABG]KLT67919.1 hypothetical protein AB674_20020 [Flavobacterium sp. ABG]
MINKIFENLVYLFYPKNVSAYTEKEKYFETEEYIRLSNIIAGFDTEESKKRHIALINEFEKDYTLKGFRDFSAFDLEDRCTTFCLTIIEEGELYTLSLYTSFLIPYYVVKCQKNMIEMFFSDLEIAQLQKDNIETRKIPDLILEIETIVESKLLYKKFPKEMLGNVIQDVSFQDSDFGYFNLFNAFFNNCII